MTQRHAKITIHTREVGARLDGWLAARFTYHTLDEWITLIETQRLLVNGTSCPVDYLICAGDEVAYHPVSLKEPEVSRDIQVLYEDDIDVAAEGLDIVIPTGMGAGRNVINVLSSDVVVACRGTGGTLSEIALALRFGRPVVLLDFDPGEAFLSAAAPDPEWSLAATPAEAAELVAGYLEKLGRK